MDQVSQQPKKPSSIDRTVGIQLRLARRHADLTQADLAAQLGIKAQQIQKYEKGVNRISAGHLYELAKVLELPISYFFDPLSLQGDALSSTEAGSSYVECQELIRCLRDSSRLPIVAEFLRMAVQAERTNS